MKCHNCGEEIGASNLCKNCGTNNSFDIDWDLPEYIKKWRNSPNDEENIGYSQRFLYGSQNTIHHENREEGNNRRNREKQQLDRISKQHRNEIKWKIPKRFLVVMIVVGLLLGGIAIFGFVERIIIEKDYYSLIDQVKKSTNPNYPGLTYGEVFKIYAEECDFNLEWQRGLVENSTTDEKIDVATIIISDKTLDEKVALSVSPIDENTAKVELLYIDGEKAPYEQCKDLEKTIFNYALIREGLASDNLETNNGMSSADEMIIEEIRKNQESESVLQEQSDTQEQLDSAPSNTNTTSATYDLPVWFDGSKIYSNEGLQVYLTFQDYGDGNIVVEFNGYNGHGLSFFRTDGPGVLQDGEAYGYASDDTTHPDAGMFYSPTRDDFTIFGTENGQFDGTYTANLIQLGDNGVVISGYSSSEESEAKNVEDSSLGTVTLRDGRELSVTEYSPSNLVKLTNICCVLDGSLFSDGLPVVTERGLLLEEPAIGYIADNSYLTQGFLNQFSAKGICFAKNEIYAKHGRIFSSQELSDYFNSMPWYEGVISPEEFSDTVFNEYEVTNIQMLLDYENRIGSYLPN